MKALAGGEVADPLLCELGAGHDLDDVEGGPADVVAAHLQVGQLEHGVCLNRQVVLPQLLLDLLQTLGDVLGRLLLFVPDLPRRNKSVMFLSNILSSLQVTLRLQQHHTDPFFNYSQTLARNCVYAAIQKLQDTNLLSCNYTAIRQHLPQDGS